MTVKTEPFISGKYGWDFGESGWNVGADENWLKFSYMLNGKITAIETSDANAASYADGTAYWNSSDQTINPKVNGTTKKYTLPRGFNLTSTDGTVKYEYTGSTLALSMTPADKVRLDSILVSPAITGQVSIKDPYPNITLWDTDSVTGDMSAGVSFRVNSGYGGSIGHNVSNVLDISNVVGDIRATAPFVFNESVSFSTAKNIKGDFSNATISSRTHFQAAAANSATSLGLIPSGTNQVSNITLNNSSTPDNCSFGQLSVGTASVRLTSSMRGSGTNLPFDVFVGGAVRATVLTDGKTGIGTATPSQLLEVCGEMALATAFGSPGHIAGTSGYMSLPNRYRVEWGSVTTNTDTTFPAEFDYQAGSYYALFVIPFTETVGNTAIWADSLLGKSKFQCKNAAGTLVVDTVKFLIIGRV